MTLVVVDASVVAKWFFPEPSSDAARALLDTSARFAAPDIVFAEVGNTIWKRVRTGELDDVMATKMVSDIAAIAVHAVPSHALLEDAMGVAVGAAMTVYDAMYVALAVRLSTQLLTADERLYRVLSRVPALSQHLQLVSDT